PPPGLYPVVPFDPLVQNACPVPPPPPSSGPELELPGCCSPEPPATPLRPLPPSHELFPEIEPEPTPPGPNEPSPLPPPPLYPSPPFAGYPPPPPPPPCPPAPPLVPVVP